MSLHQPGNTKGGSITLPLASCLTGLESAVWRLTIFVFICKMEKSKPVKHEVNGTVILPPLVFPEYTIKSEENKTTPKSHVQIDLKWIWTREYENYNARFGKKNFFNGDYNDILFFMVPRFFIDLSFHPMTKNCFSR